MGRYADLVALPAFRGLDSVPTSQLAQLRQAEGDVPGDYVEFLTEVGAGTIGESSFSIYTGLAPADDIYDPATARRLSHVVLFGDDFQGFGFGFDRNQDWAVVEVDPTNHSLDVVAPDFETFVRETLLDFVSGAA